MTLWTRRCSAGLLALAMLAQTACDPDTTPAFSGDAEQDMRLIHDNGVLMNGMLMNGVLMNGFINARRCAAGAMLVTYFWTW